MMHVAVIGSGVIGLTSAHSILDRWPDASVTVISDRPLHDITSVGPPAVYRPVSGKIPDPGKAMFRKWQTMTYQKVQSLWKCPLNDPNDSGIQLISCYIFGKDVEWYSKDSEDCGYLLHCSVLTKEQALYHSNGLCDNGVFVTSFSSEGQRYIPWLKRRAIKRGVQFVQYHVSDIRQIADAYDVVVNCCGFAASELVADPHMVPVRGLFVQVKCPGVKHQYVIDDYNNIYPGVDTVFLGNVRQVGSSDQGYTVDEVNGILERTSRVLPCLKDAPIVSVWAGIRPMRVVDESAALSWSGMSTTPRVETEMLKVGNCKTIPVIHNYGHGSQGFILSWGCAHGVVCLIEKQLKEKAKL